LWLLKRNALCSIATVTPEGRAHINTAYFAYSNDLELYFLSHPGSRHCRNLEANRSVAITVFPSSQKWGQDDHGLQLFGIAARAKGRYAKQAGRLYAKRFRAYTSWKAGLEPGDLAREYRLYRIRVSELKLFDERNFGGAVFVSARVVRSSRKK
jgi:uncharacterized protein YhbP (UPF0306 family)